MRMMLEPPESPRNATRWRGRCARWVPLTPGCSAVVGTHHGFAEPQRLKGRRGGGGLRRVFVCVCVCVPPPPLRLAPAPTGSPALLHAVALSESGGRWGSGFFRLAASALSPSSRVAVQVGRAAGTQLAGWGGNQKKLGCLEEPEVCRCSFEAPPRAAPLPSWCFFFFFSRRCHTSRGHWGHRVLLSLASSHRRTEGIRQTLVCPEVRICNSYREDSVSLSLCLSFSLSPVQTITRPDFHHLGI